MMYELENVPDEDVDDQRSEKGEIENVTVVDCSNLEFESSVSVLMDQFAVHSSVRVYLLEMKKISSLVKITFSRYPKTMVKFICQSSFTIMIFRKSRGKEICLW